MHPSSKSNNLNNRSSVASNSFNSNFKYSNFSNFSTNSKNNMNFKGMNNLGLTSKQQTDSRPLLDKNFQKKCNDKILQFLCTHNYEYSIPYGKNISELGRTEFIRIFTFIVKLAREDYQFTLNKLDEDIPKILIEFYYPNVISKSSLQAIGAPNSNGQLIAMIHWLVEYAECILNFEEKIENNKKNLNNNDKSDLNDIDFDELEKEFLINSYFEAMSQNDNESNSLSLQILTEQIDIKKKDKEKELEEIIHDTNNIKEQILTITSTLKSYKDISMNLENSKNDLNEVDAEFLNKTIALQNITRELDTLKAEYNEVHKKKVELENEENVNKLIVEKQIMNKEEFDNLKLRENNNNDLITNYENSITTVNNSLSNKKGEIQQILKNTNSFLDKNKQFLTKYIQDSNNEENLLFRFNQAKLQIEDFFDKIDFENENTLEEFDSNILSEIKALIELLEKDLTMKLYSDMLLLENHCEQLSINYDHLQNELKQVKEEKVSLQKELETKETERSNLALEYESLTSNLNGIKKINFDDEVKLTNDIENNLIIKSNIEINIKELEEKLKQLNTYTIELQKEYEKLEQEVTNTILNAEENYNLEISCLYKLKDSSCKNILSLVNKLEKQSQNIIEIMKHDINKVNLCLNTDDKEENS